MLKAVSTFLGAATCDRDQATVNRPIDSVRGAYPA
jgi:hypothetical protein